MGIKNMTKRALADALETARSEIARLQEQVEHARIGRAEMLLASITLFDIEKTGRAKERRHREWALMKARTALHKCWKDSAA